MYIYVHKYMYVCIHINIQAYTLVPSYHSKRP